MEGETSLDYLEGQYQSSPQPADWMGPIKRKLGLLDNTRWRSMWKVKNKLREDAYSPRSVAIGPYHSPIITARSFTQQILINKYEHQLQEMEEHKWRYMLYFLYRTLNAVETLDQCGKAILTLEEKVRGSYAEGINAESHELAEIMLVDGCFILELFLRFFFKDFSEGDPIFHNDSMVSDIRRDLLLLENQIPFFILKELFHIVVGHFPEPLVFSITGLALRFFYPDLNFHNESIRENCNQVGCYLHLLDLLCQFGLPCYLDWDSENSIQKKHGKSLGSERCVTKLLEAGIEFVKGEEAHLWDISFSGSVIKIPPLHIDETTESLFRNLIAFQKGGNLGSTHHISSYAILMNSLIRSRADLKLLQQRGIITYQVGMEDVLDFFKNISEEVVVKDFHFSSLCEDVNAYQVSRLDWHKQKAILKVRWRAYVATTKKKWVKYIVDLNNEYFSNPWHVMSVIGALLLLILTGLQTYYTVRPYLHLP